MSQLITFSKGEKGQGRSYYSLGTAVIPSVAVTKLLLKVKDQTGSKLDREFYQTLGVHEGFLDALDANGISPEMAVDTFRKLHEENTSSKETEGTRASKIERTAEVFVKGICKRFKGSPEELVNTFLDAVSSPEFKNIAVATISAFKNDNGVNATGHIKTSQRKGNPAAQKALAKARAAKQTGKK